MTTVLKVIALLAVGSVMGACKPTVEPPPPVMYTVTFDSMGGSAVDSVKVENGSYISSFPYPKNTSGDSISDDLVFAGWYTVQDGNGAENRFEQSMAVTSHLTVYASWKEPNLPDARYKLSSQKNSYYVSRAAGSIPEEVVIASTYNGFPVTEVSSYAFYSHDVTSVVIPDTVKKIGDSAFEYNENLTTVTIPHSVTSIGNSAFRECYNLKNITIPENITTIELNFLDKCYYLTTVIIPSGVEFIDDFAFNDLISLKNITIPESVTTIESHAFFGCGRDNFEINVEGKTKKPEWNEVTSTGWHDNWDIKDYDNNLHTVNWGQ